MGLAGLSKWFQYLITDRAVLNESASTRITGTQTQKNLWVVGFAHVLATLAPSLYLYPVPYLCTSTYTYTYKHSGIPAILVPRLKRGCTLQVWNGFILPRFPTSRMTKPFWAKATESTFIVGNGSMCVRKKGVDVVIFRAKFVWN